MSALESVKPVPATPTCSKGLQLYCPKCNEPSANVALHLCDCETFTCQECEEEFSVADIHELMEQVAKWAPILKWIDSAPTQPE